VLFRSQYESRKAIVSNGWCWGKPEELQYESRKAIVSNGWCWGKPEELQYESRKAIVSNGWCWGKPEELQYEKMLPAQGSKRMQVRSFLLYFLLPSILFSIYPSLFKVSFFRFFFSL
jgi:hypothetical protein